jgi:hypothetical protein
MSAHRRHHRRPETPVPGRAAPHAKIVRLALAGLLALAAALLVSCGGSSAKLIPIADAGPLQSDFETVQQDAETGDGNCSATETALLKTEQDFAKLPATVDPGLRATLRQGVEHLRSTALALCTEPLAQTARTTSTPKTAPSTSTSTTTPTTTTSTTTTPTTSTPSTTPTSTSPGGGTPAPGETPPGTGGEQGGTGVGENGGANGSSSPPEGSAGAGGIGASPQEGVK